MSTPSVEMKPTGQVMQEVFLSPRVLDGRAFDHFSESLRALIEQAATQTAALAEAAVRAEQAQERLAQRAAAIETRVEAAQTSIQLVAAQSEEMRRSMGAVEEAGLRLRTLELATSRGIEDAQKRLTQLESITGARLTEAIADVTAQVDQLEARLNAAEARIRQLSTDGPVAMLRAVCERAERLLATSKAGNQPTLGDIVTRGERLLGWVKQASTDLAQLQDQSQMVRTMLGESVLAAADAVDRLEERRQ